MRAKLLLAAAIAALVVAPGALGATETVTEVERIPFDSEVFSECTFEDIDVEGTMLVNSQITFDSSGGAHFLLTLALQDVSGVTASGQRIRFISTNVFQDSFLSAGTFSFTGTSNLNQLGVVQGPRNNFFLDFTFHFTLTPTGHETVVSNVRFGCR